MGAHRLGIEKLLENGLSFEQYAFFVRNVYDMGVSLGELASRISSADFIFTIEDPRMYRAFVFFSQKRFGVYELGFVYPDGYMQDIVALAKSLKYFSHIIASMLPGNSTIEAFCSEDVTSSKRFAEFFGLQERCTLPEYTRGGENFSLLTARI